MSVKAIITMKLATGLASAAVAGADGDRSQALAALTGALVTVLSARRDSGVGADLDTVIESLKLSRPLLGRATPEAIESLVRGGDA